MRCDDDFLGNKTALDNVMVGPVQSGPSSGGGFGAGDGKQTSGTGSSSAACLAPPASDRRRVGEQNGHNFAIELHHPGLESGLSLARALLMVNGLANQRAKMQFTWNINYLYVILTYFVLNLVLVYFVKRRRAQRTIWRDKTK